MEKFVDYLLLENTGKKLKNLLDIKNLYNQKNIPMYFVGINEDELFQYKIKIINKYLKNDEINFEYFSIALNNETSYKKLIKKLKSNPEIICVIIKPNMDILKNFDDEIEIELIKTDFDEKIIEIKKNTNYYVEIENK